MCLHALPLFLVGMLVVVVAWSSFLFCVYAIVYLAVCVYFVIGLLVLRRIVDCTQFHSFRLGMYILRGFGICVYDIC